MVSDPSPRWRSAPPIRTAYLVRPLGSLPPQQSPLRGVDRATALGHALSALRVGCVLTSPSRPARDTADRIAHSCGLHVIVDNRLAARRLVPTERPDIAKTARLVTVSDVGGALADAITYTTLRVVLVVDAPARSQFLATFAGAHDRSNRPDPIDEECVPLEFVDDRWRVAVAGATGSRPVVLAEGRVR